MEDEDILRFYNAGILTGSDDYGTFRGLSPLNRGQAAAMLARIVSPAQRVKSSLKTFVASQVFLGLAPETPMVTVDGYTVTAETYTYFLLLHLAAAKMENYFSIYDTYPAYFEAYMQDDAFEGDFRAYLLEKHGIQADAPIAWDAPDKGGMTPAQKVRSETLKSVTQLAAIMGRRADYPLTAQQKEELRAYVASSGLYGYSDAMTEELGTMMFTLDNITDAFSLTSDQLDEYLEESGYVYGQYVSIYRGEEGFFETDQQAREAAETARGQMNAHRDDAEYLEYLIWKYSDDHATAPYLDRRRSALPLQPPDPVPAGSGAGVPCPGGRGPLSGGAEAGPLPGRDGGPQCRHDPCRGTGGQVGGGRRRHPLPRLPGPAHRRSGPGLFCPCTMTGISHILDTERIYDDDAISYPYLRGAAPL